MPSPPTDHPNAAAQTEVAQSGNAMPPATKPANRPLRRRLPWDIRQYVRMGVRTTPGKILVQSSFWLAAAAVGVMTAYLGKLITWLQEIYMTWFTNHLIWTSVGTPLAFLASVGVCKYLAPEAGGSGVPQVLHAAAQTRRRGTPDNPRLVSLRTACVKVVSTTFGFLGGASIGGEGPTVQISASIFAHVGKRVRRVFPQIDYHSFLVAGAGAGIAAAFNTPIGGLAFAMEEVALEGFGKLRHMVMLAVIVSGLAAQGLMGDDMYFGKLVLPVERVPGLLFWAIIIGLVGGLFGGLFGRLVTTTTFNRFKTPWWARALVCGVIIMTLNLVFHGETAGSGYRITREFLDGTAPDMPHVFPVAKMLATGFSTLSGMGGGILAPSLSIGAWLGVTTGKLFSLPFLKECALMGMVAFFAGAFQVPMTALVIVAEMTNAPGLIIPMMVAALCAFVIGKLIMPISLYHTLIMRNYEKAGQHDAVAEATPPAADAATKGPDMADAGGRTPL